MTAAPRTALNPAVAPTPSLPWWVSLLGCLVLAAVVYLPTALHAEFLNFDDNFFFGPDNPQFQDGIRAVLDPRRTIANVWLPVSHLSLWLDWQVFGGRPVGPHVMSVLLHALAGFALVRAFVQLRVGKWPAQLAGALFLVHPALCESVLWVSSRKDVLAGLFVFLALGATAQYARRPGIGRLTWIAALTVLAMYSKATAVVLPFVLLLAVLYTGGDRRSFLPPLVSLLVMLPIAWHHQLLAASEGTMASGSFGERLQQVPGAFLHYLLTTFAPTGLNVLYPEVQTLAAFRAALLPGLAIVGLLLACSVLLWRTAPLRAAGFGFLLLLTALLPFNTAFPASAIAAADRYLYLAIPGAALALAALLPVLLRRGAVVGLLLPLPLLWLGWQRAPAFASSEALWQASLATDDDNSVAHTNLVADLQTRRPDQIELMQHHLEAAVTTARYPVHELRARLALMRLHQQLGHLDLAADQATAAVAAAERVLAAETSPQRQRQALGELLQTLLETFQPLRLAHRSDAAQQCWHRAQQLAPTHPSVVAFESLLLLAEYSGKPAAEIASDARVQASMLQLRAALTKSENDHDLNLAMGLWQAAQGSSMQAIKHLRRAIGARPGSPEAYVHAAAVCRQNGLQEDAEKFARGGLALCRPSDPRLRYELALSLAGSQRLDEAILQLEAYMATAPHDHDAARVLSSFLCGKAIAGMNEKPKAELEDLLTRALHWRPDEPRVDIVRGKLCRDQRQFQQAIERLERAHAAFPDLADVTTQLAQSYFDLGYQKRFAKPSDIDGAIAAWRKYLVLATPELDTAGVKVQLEGLWRSAESEGVAKLAAGDKAAAVACFRRCLQIDPDQHWPAWQLATVLFDAPDTDQKELVALLQKAVAWQKAQQQDRSRQVLLLVLVMQRQGQVEQGRQLGNEYLQAADPGADPEALRMLRELVLR